MDYYIKRVDNLNSLDLCLLSIDAEMYAAEVGGKYIEILWFPDSNRAGVCGNGNSVWTDAGSVAEALDRFLTGDIIE